MGAQRRGAQAAKLLLSVEEAAALLGTSKATLYRAVQDGSLPVPVFMIGKRLRIARRSIEQLLNGELGHPSRLSSGDDSSGFRVRSS
jgi:excisionase family DNA binding protein